MNLLLLRNIILRHLKFNDQVLAINSRSFVISFNPVIVRGLRINKHLSPFSSFFFKTLKIVLIIDLPVLSIDV